MRQTVILAAGTFPGKGTAARRLLEGAARVVCCDGAADAYRRYCHREPAAVVGDLDSLRGVFEQTLRIPEQETNDLAKAAAYCRERGWKSPIVLGATGRREDHTIDNVFRALDLKLVVVTDYGRFIPFENRLTLRLAPGAAVSLFAPDSATRMTSKGLKWPLDDVRFDTLYRASHNLATARRVLLTTTRPALVYLPEPLKIRD